MMLGLALSICNPMGPGTPAPDHYDYEWTLVTDEVTDMNPRDGAGLTYHNTTGKYWLIGGWNSANSWPIGVGGVESTNEVWSSDDAETWTMELAHVSEPPVSGAGARFKPRHVFGCLTHTVNGTEYIYVLGGDEESAGHDDFSGSPSNGYQTDMWRSADGVTWERVLESDECPFAGRTQIVYGSSGSLLWAFGGQNGLLMEDPSTFHNALYSSPDGATWTERIADGTPSATLPAPRGSVNRLAYWQGRMWLVGGGTYDTADVTDRNYYREVWSFDPTDPESGWTQHAKPPWPGTMYNNVEVLNNRLWLLAGFSDPTDSGPVGEGKNTKTVWSSGDGERWVREETPPWIRSHADATCVHGSTLVHMTGNGDILEGDAGAHVATLVATAVQDPVELPAAIATWDIADAVVSGSNITSIPDGTGNGHHLVPTTPGDATYNETDEDFGGGPSAEGDATNGGFLHTTDNVSLAGFTLFIVAKFGTDTGARYLAYSLLISPLAYSYADFTKVSSHKYSMSTANLRSGVDTAGGIADPAVEMEDTRHVYRYHFDGTNEGTHVAIDGAIELPGPTPLTGDAGTGAFSRPLYIGSDSSGTFCRAIKFVAGRLYPALTAEQYRQVERDLREAYPYSIPIP
jgi:hypothetical protein